MLISKPKPPAVEPLQLTLAQQQYVETQLLPIEQAKKFTAEFTELLHQEAIKESREPEEALLIKNIFDALHTHNVSKLLGYLQGVDRTRIFYALKKQLLAVEATADGKRSFFKVKPNKHQIVLMNEVLKKEVSLITLAALR